MRRRRFGFGGRSAGWVFWVLAIAATGATCGNGTSSTPGPDEPAAGYTVSGDGGPLGEDAGTLPTSCASSTECPPATDECMRSVCRPDGFCGYTASAAATPALSQTAGDCRVNLCDGAGGVTSAPDDTDLADDGNGCTADACASGAPVFTNRPAGASCAEAGGDVGGAVCDGHGQCMAPLPNS